MSLETPSTVGALGLASEPAQLTAFITASNSVDTSVVREALRERGYAPFSLDEVEARGRSIPELLKEYVSKADLVVAVIGDDPTTKNVYYELGFAQAWDKRVLALTHSGLIPQPQGIACLRIDPANREAIDFGLDMILAAPKEKSRSPRGDGFQTRPIGDLADELLDRFRRDRDKIPEVEIREIVAQAINASGVSALSRSMKVRGGIADLAIWSDDLEPWIGNPLIVEIKRDLGGERSVHQAVSQLSRYLDASTAPFGLLVCGELRIDPEMNASIPPNIIVVSLEQFLGSLKTTSFGNYMLQRRNERVHARR
jgi:hypothetical protein